MADGTEVRIKRLPEKLELERTEGAPEDSLKLIFQSGTAVLRFSASRRPVTTAASGRRCLPAAAARRC